MSEEKKQRDPQTAPNDANDAEAVKKVDFDTAILNDTSIFAATNEIEKQKEDSAAAAAEETAKETAEPKKTAAAKESAEPKKTAAAKAPAAPVEKAAKTPAKKTAQTKTEVKKPGSDASKETEEDEKNETNWGKELRDWIVAIGIAVVLALVIRNYVFTLVKVQGQSMEPTLHNADRLYVNRFLYTPKKGDVIIFVPESDPNRPYVKRVIATAGDSVYIDFKTGNVFVNGQLLDEPYIKEKTRNNGSYIMSLMQQGNYGPDAPIVIQEGHIFVMGDNRNNSKDSRELGQVPLDEVLGGAVFRFWPLDHLGSVHRDAISTSYAEDNDVYGLGSSNWDIEG